MGPGVWKSTLIFLTGSLFWILASWAYELHAADIYSEIFSSQEEYLVKKGDQLPSLAQKRAMPSRVLAKQINLKNPNAIKPGMNLTIRYSFIPPNDVTDGLVVNLAELAVYHFQNGVFLRRYPIAAGRVDWETPTGNYKILNKLKNPTWRVPTSIQWEMWDRGQVVIDEVPPGPKNPLGAFWMATSAPGVGLHATTSPWSVGRYASHGCLRMLRDDIEELFNQIEVGTPVKIIYKPVKLAVTTDNRIFLEVHGDYYRRVPSFYQEVQTLAKSRQLESRVDWQRVKQVIKERDGQANDVTKNNEPVAAELHIGQRLYTGEVINKTATATVAPNGRPEMKKKPLGQPGF
jgi:L,D-transpeptidase ErfK/SrfK